MESWLVALVRALTILMLGLVALWSLKLARIQEAKLSWLAKLMDFYLQHRRTMPCGEIIHQLLFDWALDIWQAWERSRRLCTTARVAVAGKFRMKSTPLRQIKKISRRPLRIYRDKLKTAREMWFAREASLASSRHPRKKRGQPRTWPKLKTCSTSRRTSWVPGRSWGKLRHHQVTADKKIVTHLRLINKPKPKMMLYHCTNPHKQRTLNTINPRRWSV